MREVIIDTKDKTYSTLHFAASLNQAAYKYVSDILIKIESENHVSGQVDLKSYLGTIAVMSNQSSAIHLVIIGEDEDAAAFGMQRTIEKLLENY